MKQRLVNWFRNPWLLLPLFLVSLSGALLLGHVYTSPTPQATPIAAAPPSPVPPAASSTPTPKPTPKPSAKPSPKALPSPRAPLTAEQKAMNQRAIAAFEAAAPSVDSFVEMHVAIAQGVPSLSLGASSGAELLDKNGKRVGQLSTGSRYPVAASGAALAIGSLDLPAIVWVEPGVGGLLYVGDRSYRGRLLLVAEGGSLWAVNYVDLRRYLHSVVASEVSPDWSTAALKAQAIAARSYALVYYFRPATSLYHLDNTERFQVYGGIEREADTIRSAVDATAGEFVSYRGGVVESLYAASDEIVAEAFAGRGMSQLGAYDLAKQGYTYQQILSHYYPSTGISRFEIDQE